MNDLAEQKTSDWPERPWLMAAVGAVTGLLIDWIGDGWWHRAAGDRLTHGSSSTRVGG